eukprot:gene40614-53717_t
MHRKRLLPGQRVPAKTKHHALQDGERLGRTAEGVAVIHFVADDETGEVSALDLHARHESIPDEFEEQIRALLGQGVEASEPAEGTSFAHVEAILKLLEPEAIKQ